MWNLYICMKDNKDSCMIITCKIWVLIGTKKNTVKIYHREIHRFISVNIYRLWKLYGFLYLRKENTNTGLINYELLYFYYFLCKPDTTSNPINNWLSWHIQNHLKFRSLTFQIFEAHMISFSIYDLHKSIMHVNCQVMVKQFVNEIIQGLY